MNATKLYVVRNTPQAMQTCLALWAARGLAPPRQPDMLIGIVDQDGHMVSAVSLNHERDAERVSWVITNPEESLVMRHAATRIALEYAVDVALVRGVDVTIAVGVPIGVLMLLQRVAGAPRIERTARFAPTSRPAVKVSPVRRRRASARASSSA